VDKVLELCLRSIIRHISGDMELSKEYQELALEIDFDTKCICRIEDHISKNTKRNLYEMVS
jgi:hypothetical protein